MVFLYSLVDNVIITRTPPTFVGLSNYIRIISDSHFREALGNTLVFSGVSVVAHFLIGLTFAMLLNTQLVGIIPRALFRVISILPWVFTASVIAILWRLLVPPTGAGDFELVGVWGGVTEN